MTCTGYGSKPWDCHVQTPLVRHRNPSQQPVCVCVYVCTYSNLWLSLVCLSPLVCIQPRYTCLPFITFPFISATTCTHTHTHTITQSFSCRTERSTKLNTSTLDCSVHSPSVHHHASQILWSQNLLLFTYVLHFVAVQLFGHWASPSLNLLRLKTHMDIAIPF